MANNFSGKLDLLIIIVDKDFLKISAREIKYALQSLDKSYAVMIESLQHLDRGTEKIVCKKVLFLLSGCMKHLNELVNAWISQIKSTKKKKTTKIFTVLEEVDAEETVVNDNLFDSRSVPKLWKEHALKITTFKNVATWWPATIEFIFAEQMRHVSYTYKIIKVKGKETLTAECVECIVKILQYFSLNFASCEEQPALHLIVVDKDITDFAYVRNKLPENCENVVLIANNTPVTEAFRRLSKYVFSKTDILQCIVRVLITMWTLGYQQNIRLLRCCFQRNTELRYAYRVLKRMQVQMKLPQDKMSCFISSCIMSPTGRVIVSDFNSKSLKLLGHYEVLNVCNVPEQQCDMCIILNNKIAVSVEKKFIIFIVESEDNLEIKGSMKIGQTGIGIECRDEILYISDSQSIYMYTLSGELIQELFSDRSTLKTIERLKICEDGLKIYVTNSTANELIVLDIEGLKLDTFKGKHDPRIGHLLGLCTADYGIVFACDYYSETIVQVSVKRMELGTITGIKRPRCCCFDKDEAMLYVGQADGNLVIFDMKQTRLL